MATVAVSNPWAILLCKWNDDASEPFSPLCCQSLFSTAGIGLNNMVDFFRLYSHGVVDLSGSQVFGWFVLPQARSQYTGSGANDAGRQALINWCITAAAAAGVDLNPFFGVVCCMNDSTDLFGDIGFPRVVCDNGSLNPAPLAQEMLHGYGLNHARLDGTTADYTDPFDVMSVFRASSAFDLNFPACTSLSGEKLIGPGLNAALMTSKLWFDAERFWLYNPGVTPPDATVQLRPHHRRDLPGFLIAKVGPFYVEFRMNEGFDAGLFEPVVLIHRYDGFDQHSYLMTASDGSQFLVAGSTFDKTVPLINPSASGGRVVVNVTGIDPLQRIATISIAGTTYGPGPGTQIVVTGTGTTTGTRGTGTRGTVVGTGTRMYTGFNRQSITAPESGDSLMQAIRVLDDVPIRRWDLDLLLDLHRRLLPVTYPGRGRLRTEAGVVWLHGRVQKELPSPSQSITIVEATLEHLKQTIERSAAVNWFALASETMLRLLDAHPFADGNGRVSRAVATWLLVRGGYEVTLSLGLYCRQHVDEYYGAVVKAIEMQTADGARELWDAFFENMVRACFNGPESRQKPH